MITVPEATEKIVRRSRYLTEALSKDIINISGLARYIKPEVEAMLVKDVSISSIIMALKRIGGDLFPSTPYQEIFPNPPQITARTSLALLISRKSFGLKYLLRTENDQNSVILGSHEDLKLHSDENSRIFHPVGAVSISVPEGSIDSPGIYYFFIKSLAWERINILHIFTTSSEITLIVNEDDLQRTLGVLRSLFLEIS